MANVFDYLDWRGDLSFRADPFNVVDNIIFSIFSYYPFDGIVGRDFTEAAVPMTEAVKKLCAAMKGDPSIERLFLFGERQKNFLFRLAEVRRYSDCTLRGYVNKVDSSREMQFAVITIQMPDTQAYISFRGTDAAIVGWKEDFNMILDEAIPAQIEAAAYLNAAAKQIDGKINIGGHSKGGNLAVYAASFCDAAIQNRIETVYSNDAPGFNKSVTASRQYKNIESKIDCYIPQGSVIGLLFEYVKHYKVVKSSETGLLQHDPFSWELTGKNMIYISSITKESHFVNKTLMQWLENMDQPARLIFIETLFTIVNEANIKSIPDFTDNTLKNTALLIKSLHNVDNESKKMLFKAFSALFEIAKSNIYYFLGGKPPIKKQNTPAVNYDTI
jgi:tRNA threonylcarbamoyladenosine modification (KEOPS) complex Cgi121 subunit